MLRKRSSLLALAVTAAVVCSGTAFAYAPTIIEIEPPPIEVNGGFSPVRLPKSELAPIHVKVEGTVNAADENGHLLRLEQLVVELGRNIAIDAKGLPRCSPRPPDLPFAKPSCQSARIGKGELEVQVEFPESEPSILKSHVVAFNGGVKGGVTTILIHAYLSSPVSAAVIVTVKVSKVHNGPYGTKSIATIPVIAGGNGSVKRFQLEFFREFAYKRKRRSFLSASCPAGKLGAHWEAKFADNATAAAGSFARPCTPKG